MSIRVAPGSAVVATAAGQIVRILEDQLRLFPGVDGWAPLVTIFEDGSIDKFFAMLRRAADGHALRDWELLLRADKNSESVRIAATACDGEIVVAIAPSSSDLGDFLSAMALVRTHYQSAWRSLERASDAAARDSERLSFLSEINNELVNAQRDLSNAQAELECVVAEKNQLIGILAHDMRGPLQNIMLASDHLSPDRQPAGQQRFIDVIRNSAGMMARLIDNTLDQAAIESGELTLSRQTVDVAAIAGELIGMLQGAAAQKSVSIDLEVDAAPFEASVDVTRFEQILSNLVYNAIKFCQQGAAVHVRLSAEGDGFVLEVADTGPGIPATTLDRLYRPYHGGSRGTAGESGVGLGLAIVYRFVKAHGGTIDCESVEGEGTTFTLRFPAAAGD